MDVAAIETIVLIALKAFRVFRLRPIRTRPNFLSLPPPLLLLLPFVAVINRAPTREIKSDSAVIIRGASNARVTMQRGFEEPR